MHWHSDRVWWESRNVTGCTLPVFTHGVGQGGVCVCGVCRYVCLCVWCVQHDECAQGTGSECVGNMNMLDQSQYNIVD